MTCRAPSAPISQGVEGEKSSFSLSAAHERKDERGGAGEKANRFAAPRSKRHAHAAVTLCNTFHHSVDAIFLVVAQLEGAHRYRGLGIFDRNLLLGGSRSSGSGSCVTSRQQKQ